MHSFKLKRGIAAPGWLALMLALAHATPWAVPDTTNKAEAPNTLEGVKVKARRNGGATESTVIAAHSKVLSHRYASTCAFLAGGQDEVTLAYMRGLYADGDPLLGVEVDEETGKLVERKDQRFSDLSPGGDASSGTDNDRMIDQMLKQVDIANDSFNRVPYTNCTLADVNLAAGHNYIARKDKSLTQAFDAYEGGNYAEALARFEESWKKLGYEDAALMLGRLHLLGLGTPASTPKAVRWLREVVDARYDPVTDRLRFDPRKPEALNTRVEAALLLARIHLTGAGTKRDAAEAYKWWRKALDFGYEPAGTLLAQAHLTGVGPQPDIQRALSLLQTAGEAGDVNALYLLGQLYHHQWPRQPEGVPLDLKRAGAYYLAATKAGHADATYAAARMLDLGEGVPAAPERAVVLYKDAALKGNADAQNALATYFYRGEVVEQNLDTARQFFQTAAKQMQADAMFNLAVMLAHGQGGARDLATAYAWCSLSKRLGHQQAATALPAIEARLSPEDKARADTLLKPAPKKS
ncbi:tetratricopeptide repeat protein [Roseateles sp. LYH14W]|uniref:Tetratricopeptide repeat protein n=1 Tax=Pelomonas parva TaxID=3299032 RepID=A0ABW7FAK7_9BURK